MPYFNQLYGPKYVGMLSLAAIYALMSVNSVVAKIEVIVRAYSITGSGFRVVPLRDKIIAVTGLAKDAIIIPVISLPTPNLTPINLS